MSYGLDSVPFELEPINAQAPKPRHDEFSRPKFLKLTNDDFEKGRDHATREILSPINEVTKEIMPWNAGYAEVINAGKSEKNEDQSWLFAGVMISGSKQLRPSNEYMGASLAKREDSIAVVMFGVCDGHAGWGAALYVSKVFAARISERLEAIKHFLFKSIENGSELIYKTADNMYGRDDVIPTELQETITTENLVTGVLEECFREMDDEIRRSLSTFDIAGGCTCLVVLIMLGKVYVANAGDCRAILVRKKKQGGFCFEELSQDHNPITDRQRVQSIAYLQPELLGMFDQGISWGVLNTFRQGQAPKGLKSVFSGHQCCSRNSSRILHEICLLIGKLVIRGMKLTLNARLGTKSNLLLEQYCVAIRRTLL